MPTDYIFEKHVAFAAFSGPPLWAINSNKMTTRFTLIFFLICGATYTSFSQYIPLLQNNAKWNECYDFEEIVNYSFTVSGDSLINGIHYKKVTTEHGGLFNPINLLREDTTERKVFQYIDPYEQLLYNFNLSVGDSITFDNGTLILSSISDTMPYSCDMKDSITCSIYPLRVFRFNIPNDNPIFWIEGLGSVAGLLLPSYFICRDYKILCHFDSNQTWNYFYKAHNEHTPCQIPVSIPEITNNQTINVFPNPSSDGNLFIEGDNLYKAKILNLQGQSLIEIFLSGNKTNTISLPLSRGIYFIEIFSNLNERIIKKLVLN